MSILVDTAAAVVAAQAEPTGNAFMSAMCNEVFWFLVGFAVFRFGLRFGVVPRLGVNVGLPRWVGSLRSASEGRSAEPRRRRAVAKSICADDDAGQPLAVLATWRCESRATPLPADALVSVALALAAIVPTRLAVEIVEHLERHAGATPVPGALHAVLGGLVQSGHLAGAEELLAAAQARLGFCPDQRALELLLGGFAASGNEARMEAMLGELRALGDEASARCHGVVVRGFKAGAVEAAAQALEVDRRGLALPPRGLEIVRAACAGGAELLSRAPDALEEAVPLPGLSSCRGRRAAPCGGGAGAPGLLAAGGCASPACLPQAAGPAAAVRRIRPRAAPLLGDGRRPAADARSEGRTLLGGLAPRLCPEVAWSLGQDLWSKVRRPTSG